MNINCYSCPYAVCVCFFLCHALGTSPSHLLLIRLTRATVFAEFLNLPLSKPRPTSNTSEVRVHLLFCCVPLLDDVVFHGRRWVSKMRLQLLTAHRVSFESLDLSLSKLPLATLAFEIRVECRGSAASWSSLCLSSSYTNTQIHNLCPCHLHSGYTEKPL